MEIFRTARLRAREMSLHDLDFIAALLADPEVMRFYPKLHSRAEARGWIERQISRYAAHGHGLWLIEERTTGDPVGQVGLLTQTVDEREEPEIGYLLHRPYWKRGYATEAAAATRDYAFDTLRLPCVISLIRPENLPSQAVARRLGMRPVRSTLFANLEHLVFSVSAAGAHSGSDPAPAEIVPFSVSDQDRVEEFFRETWRTGRFPFDPVGAHADLRRIGQVYRSDGGGFWLLQMRDRIIGTVAVRRLPGNVAEVKRFNVRGDWRGKGYGNLLLRYAIDHARDAEFSAIRLDTLRQPGPAIHLFEKHGFREIERYNDNPEAEMFMERQLVDG